MRLSTEPTRDASVALATLEAALDAGVRIFDTARSYALDEHDLGHNEELLARALKRRSDVTSRVVTKCGMRRDGGAWIPDGRARSIFEDATASVSALDGIPVDLLLLHAPDPRVSIATSARALARVQEEGLARTVGLSNVSRKQLEEASGEAPIRAVEVALGAYDDAAIRGGVVGFCVERGIEVFAHSPLGGPQRVRRLMRDKELARIAASLGASPIEVFLAYLLAVRPEIVPVVGARRPETAARIVAATRLAIDEEHLAALDARFASLGRTRRPPPALPLAAARDVEVMLVMGVPGSGKSRAAQAYVERGYERLNRDLEGGTLKKIARLLEDRLVAGATRVVLDNTYVTRASRYEFVRVAGAHGAKVRCVHIETPLAEAQVNVILRLLERYGRVPGPEELVKLARTDAAALAPHAVFRMQRELEPPEENEGFATIERVAFVRQRSESDVAGTFIALAALGDAANADVLIEVLRKMPERAPALVYAWKPDAETAWLEQLRASAQRAAAATDRVVEVAVCPHPGGRPICWCRPPLPGMLLEFAQRHRIDPRTSTLFGESTTDQAMARALGMSFRAVNENP